MDNLKEKTAGGLLWGALNSGSMQILNALIGFVLARLLDPADYGIVGMLTIFIAIAGNLRDSGFVDLRPHWSIVLGWNIATTTPSFGSTCFPVWPSTSYSSSARR